MNKKVEARRQHGVVAGLVTQENTRPGIQRAIAELADEITKKETQAEQLRAEINKARKAYETLLEYAKPFEEEEGPVQNFAPRLRERRSSSAWLIRQAAHRAILRAERALSPAEILEDMAAEGISIESPNPLNKIYRTLWDAKAEFLRIGNAFDVITRLRPLAKGVSDLEH